MSEPIDRRDAIKNIGIGAAGFLWLRPRRRFVSDIDALSEQLRAATRVEAFDFAARAIRGGAEPKTLFGAVFLAALRDVRPRPHGATHTVMMIDPAFRLAEHGDAREAWLPALWALDDLKQAQDRDRREADDWKMSPHPKAASSSKSAAEQEFVAAMDAWDIERADRAVVGLLPHSNHAEFFELLWPFAARCSTFVGHKMIYAAQVERFLSRLGWQHAEPALRSLVMTILWERDTEMFEASVERSMHIPPTWRDGKEDPAESAELLAILRTDDSGAARELVITAFEHGLGPTTVWDAFRLLGAEVFYRRPGRRSNSGRIASMPVHALTVTNAFGHAWRSTRTDEAKHILMLQLASMLATMRTGVGDVRSPDSNPGIDSLANKTDVRTDFDAVFEAGDPELAFVALKHSPELGGKYLARLRRALARTGIEHHQHEYAAAMTEESERAATKWRPHIMAPAIEYLANPADPESEVYRRSVRTLEQAGI